MSIIGGRQVLKTDSKMGKSCGWPAILAAFVFVLTACVKNEVKVDFELSENVNEAYRTIYYASDKSKGWFAEGVTMVQKGKGELVCLTLNPSIVFVMRGGVSPEAGFYIERGDRITIKGDSPDPLAWEITGNDITDEWSAWRLSERNVLSSRDAARINAAVAGFVKRNPENPLSAILLCVHYDRRLDEEGFRRLWTSLKGKAAEPVWADLVGRNDMPGGVPRFGEDVAEIVAHSAETGADTLGVGRRPVILYFWRKDDISRKEGITALKTLAREYPDSSSATMADICFDPDSVSWRSQLPGDSLKRVVRGWNPKGETDSLMSRLGVRRTPFWMVLDRRGKVAYRGDAADGAQKEFRSVMAAPRKD